MATAHKDYRTAYGVIHYGPEACKDDYANLKVYDQPPEGGAPVILQGPAMRAFKAAERRYAKATGWSETRIAKQGGRPIPLTGSIRSCALQAKLYASDPNRFAHPNTTGHCRGIAIDVSTAAPYQTKIKRALAAEGWTQTRPDDEPWHWSFGVTV